MKKIFAVLFTLLFTTMLPAQVRFAKYDTLDPHNLVIFSKEVEEMTTEEALHNYYQIIYEIDKLTLVSRNLSYFEISILEIAKSRKLKLVERLSKEAPEEMRQINLKKQDKDTLKFYKAKGENVLLLTIEEVKELDEYKIYQRAHQIKNEINNIKAKGYLKIDENTGEIYTFYDFEKVEALENELNNLNITYKKHMKAFEDGYYFVFLEK